MFPKKAKANFTFLILSVVTLLVFGTCLQVGADQETLTKELYQWLESWRDAWKNGNVTEYISFYTTDARQDHRQGSLAILSHKQHLWKRSKPASILLNNVKIYGHPEGFMIVFAQQYAANNGFSDRGYKTMIIVPGSAGQKKWLIAEERWYFRKPLIFVNKLTLPDEIKKTGGAAETPLQTGQPAITPTRNMAPVSTTMSETSATNTGLQKEELEELKPEQLESTQKWTETARKESSILPKWVMNWKMTPSLAITQAYNDNIYFRTEEKIGDWRTNLAPKLELASKTERMKAGIIARFNGIYYLDQHHLNTIDQSYQSEFHYALNDTLALGAEAGYTKDFSAERDIETTGEVFHIIVNRQRFTSGASGEWHPTERLFMTFLCNYLNDRYDDPAYSDMQSYNAGINTQYSLNSLTKGRLSIGYAHYSTGASVVHNYATTMGINRNISDVWSLLVDTGISYSQSRYDTLSWVPVPGGFVLMPQQQTSNEWKPMGRVALALKHERTDGSLALNYSVLPLSGTSTTVNRTNLSLDVNHKLTYELSGFLRANYFINKSDQGEFSNKRINESSLCIVLGPRYHFNKDAFLSASYTFIKAADNQKDTSANQHQFLLAFYIQHTLME